MPVPWSPPRWNLEQAIPPPGHQHPPPAPASSTYSPAPPTVRSEALRPLSGLFGRFTTPRLGPRPQDAPDVPAIPVQLPNAAPSGPIHEAGPGQRSSDVASVISHLNVPTSDQQRGFGNNNNSRPALQPPAPIHPSSAHNAGGDLPIAFSPSEIGTPVIPNPNTNPNLPLHPAHRPRRNRHRRHRGAHHRLNSSTSLKPHTKPKSPFRDAQIKLKLLHTLISGALLLITLIVFLALSVQTDVFSPPFRIVNSLLIIFFAVIFVHSAIRLGVLVASYRKRMRRVARRKGESVDVAAGGASVDLGTGAGAARGVGFGGGRVQYFDDPEIGLPPPGEPIRVVLARDEEIGVNDDLNVVREDPHAPTGTQNAPELAREEVEETETPLYAPGASNPNQQRAQNTPKPPPPVYGVWRGSVRADPNLLHWQRVVRPGMPRSESGEEDEGEDVAHSRPPPSYVTQEMRGQGMGVGGGMQTLPATRYVI